MAKEIYISSTPHETRLAIMEDEQLTEIYYERENEYTLAGSIYKGKVTRVLPGMQSAFVELGLERDAFLYVTDFLEEQDSDTADFERAPQQRKQAALPADAGEEEGTDVFVAPVGEPAPASSEEGGEGARRLRGRRGRRRGRGGKREGIASAQPQEASTVPAEVEGEEAEFEAAEFVQYDDTDVEEFEQNTAEEEVTPRIEAAAEPQTHSSEGRRDGRRDRGSDRGRGNDRGDRGGDRNSDRGDRSRREPRESSSERPATPFVLPGESLSRARTTDEPAAAAAEETKAATPAKPTSTFKPSTMVDSEFQWDGGPLFPGESLSRHRNRPVAQPEPEPHTTLTETYEAVEGAPMTASEVVEEEWIEEEELPESEAEQVEAAAGEEHAFEEVPSETETTEEATEGEASHKVDPNPPSYFDLMKLFGRKKKPGAKTYSAIAPGTGLVEEEFDEQDEGYDYSRIGANADEGDSDDLQEETMESSGTAGQLARNTSANGATANETGAAPARPARRDGRGGDRGRRDGRGGGDRNGSGDRNSADRSRGGRRDGRGGGPRRSMQNTPLPVITELLKPGQEILVQIAKEPIAKKGARITSHIALPGRFLVFMPTVDHVGVSRRIASDEERLRLKRILLSEKGDATGGFIVRTAAEGASEEELRSDLRFLIHLWNDIKSRSDASKAPALIYHDLNLVERILRDQVSDNFTAIWVDTEAEYERVVRFMQRFQPSLVRNVKLYSKQTPLFEQFGITEEINKGLKSKVWLKSGGSIVINQTEALVAIDINTGKYVGKTARLEDTILKTNLDAIPEIIRQIRLRDLGGIIVIDFIDMDERRNRNKVMVALEEELKKDRAPSKVLQFNDFGLVAITRKRVKQSLERTLSTPCATCAGTGMTKSPVTVCNEMYIELRKMHRQIEKEDIMLRVHPEVVKELKSGQSHWISDLEDMTGKTILVKSDPTLHPEQFDIQ
jgi:Rne/Rng family ribonuclease